MESGGSQGEGPEEYDSRLQRVMQSCLPQILVDIVENRPQDPIHYLAHRLYQHRAEESRTQVREEVALNFKSPGEVAGTSPAGVVRKPTDSQQNNLSSPHTKVPVMFKIVETEDLEEDAGVRFSKHIDTRTVLHRSLDSVFKCIGDLFDLDDIS